MELKRPEVCYTTRIKAGRIKGVLGGGIDVYSRVRADSFLSDCASELERARKLREQSYKYDLDGLVKQAREKEKSASQIENKVIQALKGDKK